MTIGRITFQVRDVLVAEFDLGEWLIELADSSEAEDVAARRKHMLIHRKKYGLPVSESKRFQDATSFRFQMMRNNSHLVQSLSNNN